MIDARTTVWNHFFPADSSFTIRSGPEAFREAVRSLPGGRSYPVLVSWGEHAWEMSALDNYTGVVAINCHELSPRDLYRAGFRHVRQYAVLPSLDDARWFIPLESPRAASAALRINTPFRMLPKARHLGARAAARGGFYRLFPDQVIIAQQFEPELDRMFREMLGKDHLHYAISSGTPGPARKPTLAMLDDDGEWLAFAKIARTPIGKQLVRQEATCLSQLASRPALRASVPRLLLDTDFEDSRIVAQASLPGRMPGARITPDHHRLLGAMESRKTKPASSSGFLQSLIERGRASTIPDLNLPCMIAQIQLALQGITVPETVLHGDFTPWNLRRHNSRLTAFDWEYGHLDGLPLIDEFHYVLQAGLMLGNWTAEETWQQLADRSHALSRHTYPTSVARALQLTMLLDLVLRRHEEGHKADSPHDRIRLQLVHRLNQALEEDLR